MYQPRDISNLLVVTRSVPPDQYFSRTFDPQVKKGRVTKKNNETIRTSPYDAPRLSVEGQDPWEPPPQPLRH